MGFVAPTAIFPLTFSNPSLEGLEVWMLRPSVDAIGDMMLLGNINRNAMTHEDVRCLKSVFDAFINGLKKWNVQEQVLDANGLPTGQLSDVPANAAGVKSLDGNFLLLVILGWVETVTGLNWTTDKVAKIPMETAE